MSDSPKTINEAVDQIIDELELQDRCSVASLSVEGMEIIRMVLDHYLQQRLGKNGQEVLNDSSLDEV